MEAVKKKNDEKDDMDQEPDERPKKAKSSKPLDYASAGQASATGAYFRIYKKGQGYWTRMGTVIGVSLIGFLIANFLWEQKEVVGLHDKGGYVLVGAFIIGYALLAFHYMNKPNAVDFMIATDSEMKRVNWTSRKELIGSTKIVILFMFLMAAILFLYDLMFHTIFWLIGVLKTPPPFIKQQ